ncbi:dentin sialophosphoprotein isoform X3 [Aplysia californica]|nr:dentin sialophosphoprotein isoform X3 [Aplysia californica]
MRGLEKNVLVVSTVDPFGRKVVSESSNKPLVNGMDINGSPFSTRDPHTSTPLPPVPGWVTSTVAMASRSQNSPSQDSSDHPRPTSQVSLPEAGITSNGVSGGLVSSLYADQGEQPLSVHAEEVVEETVVTMDTNEVANVATDAGESLAEEEEEDEEMGGEDTNASSSSSSSSSSSEELSATETSENGAPALSPKVSSSTESPPQSRPWAAIADEGENEKLTEGESPSKKSRTATSPDASDTRESQENSDSSSSTSPPQSSPPSSKLDEVSSPSSVKQDSSQGQPAAAGAALSWQSISTSPDVADPPEASGSTCTCSTNVPTQASSEDSFGFDTVTTSSSTVAEEETVTDSTTGETPDAVEESVGSDNANESEATLSTSSSSSSSSSSLSESKNTSGPESLVSSAPASDEGQVCSSPPKSDPSVCETVCSTEAVASSTDTPLTAYSSSSSSSSAQSSMECDSVAGLERLVGSVEPSSVSSLSSQPAFSQPSSSSSSSSSVPPSHPTNVSDSGLPTQSGDPASPPKMEMSEHIESEAECDKQTDSSDSASDSSSQSCLPQQTTEDETMEAAVSDKVTVVMVSEPEDSGHVDSTADTTSENVEVGSDSTGSDAVDGELSTVSSELGGGDCKAEEGEEHSLSPPSQRSSSDSLGFEVCGDSLNKSVGEDKEPEDESAAVEKASESSEDVSQMDSEDPGHEPMDQV